MQNFNIFTSVNNLNMKVESADVGFLSPVHTHSKHLWPHPDQIWYRTYLHLCTGSICNSNTAEFCNVETWNKKGSRFQAMFVFQIIFFLYSKHQRAKWNQNFLKLQIPQIVWLVTYIPMYCTHWAYRCLLSAYFNNLILINVNYCW